jgi:hypothetical protein
MATATTARRIRVKAPRPTLQQAIILALSDLPPAKCKPVRIAAKRVDRNNAGARLKLNVARILIFANRACHP